MDQAFELGMGFGRDSRLIQGSRGRRDVPLAQLQFRGGGVHQPPAPGIFGLFGESSCRRQRIPGRFALAADML